MNGGYLMISKNDSDIYAKAQKALVLGKPILFYENATTCYYIDTISGGEITTEIVDDEEVTTYGDIILTKGGKTITITSANAVSESGNIQSKLYQLKFTYGDDIIVFLTHSKFEDYSFNMDNLTDDDKEYLKSLNGKLSIGAMGFADNDGDFCEGKILGTDLYLKFSSGSTNVMFNLTNPENAGEDGDCYIKCVEL